MEEMLILKNKLLYKVKSTLHGHLLWIYTQDIIGNNKVDPNFIIFSSSSDVLEILYSSCVRSYNIFIVWKF